MFSKSYKIASEFTFPLISMVKFFDGTVDSGLASFVVVNDDGWIMTAAHALEPSIAFQAHQKEIQEYNDKAIKITENPQLKDHKKKLALKGLHTNSKWVTDFVLWLGADNVEIKESFIYGQHDLAFIRVDKKIFESIKGYPAFKNPENFEVGASLCKLGYPFYPVNATYDKVANKFVLPPNIFPIPRFPMEGIFTRAYLLGKDTDARDIMFLETSTPGLKGQSGGPIFDVDGNIWALQSRTSTLPLSFKGEIEDSKGKKTSENQFMNVGLGVHGKTIVELLNKHNIKFATAD